MFANSIFSTTPAAQLASMVSYYNTNCGAAWSKKIWLEIYDITGWTSDITRNQLYFKGLIDACKATAGVTCGVISGEPTWMRLFGSWNYTYSPANTLPLWYQNWDNVASMSEWRVGSSDFGGWVTPYAKQYSGNWDVCTLTMDLNYWPF